MTFETNQKFDLIYCDMIYEDKNLIWIDKYWETLKENGIFITQTDWHTDWLVRWWFETYFKEEAIFVNDAKWKCEWGQHPSRKLHQCYDSIIIYAKGKDYKFYPERIQVDKVTKNKGLNPSGRQTKTATAWIDDICLTTTAKERVKKSDGHLMKWQKPLRLFDRIISPFTDIGDSIAEPFGGTFPVVRWSIINNRDCIGIEYDKEIFEYGKAEIEKLTQ
jgi:DNA modification methylase